MIQNKPIIGIYLKIAHGFVFTLMSLLLVKYSAEFPVIQILFLRVALGAIISFLILRLIKQPIPLKLSKSSIIFYSIRAVVSFISLVTWVGTLQNLGINEATAFGYITPIWMVFAAILFFKEKLTIKHIITISLNTIGITLVLHPKFDNISMLGIGGAIFTTILWAVYDSICKKQTLTEHYMLQCFYSLTFSTIITLPIAIYIWQPISLEAFAGFALISLLGVANVILLFLAYVYASIIVLVPFSYARVLFAVLFSYWLYHIPPTFECLLGAGIIISADLYFYIIQRNSKLTTNEIT